MSPSHLATLAEFTSQISFESLPHDVIQAAKRVVLDDLGSIIAGFRESEIDNLATTLATQSKLGGSARVFGGEFWMTDAPTAALLNGIAGVGLETDGGFRRASCHASSYVVPAVLALGETLESSGRQVVEAVVAGYEVAARLAEATTLVGPVMPHAAWSAQGSAAASSRLLGLEPTRTVTAVGLAAVVAGNGPYTEFEGSPTRNTYSGIGGRSGMVAAFASRENCGSPSPGLVKEAMRNLGPQTNPKALVQGLGDRYAISGHYHKRWSCCGFSHPALDAIDDCLQNNHLDPSDVLRVDVFTFAEGAELSDRSPNRPLVARHSVPWGVASLITRRALPPDAFAASALGHPVIRDLADRVSVHCDASLPSGFSGQRAARVTITLKNQERIELYRANVRGDASDPFTDTELRGKFLSLAEGSVGQAMAEKIVEQIDSLEQLPSVGQISASVSGAKSAPTEAIAGTFTALGSDGTELMALVDQASELTLRQPSRGGASANSKSHIVNSDTAANLFPALKERALDEAAALAFTTRLGGTARNGQGPIELAAALTAQARSLGIAPRKAREFVSIGAKLARLLEARFSRPGGRRGSIDGGAAWTLVAGAVTAALGRGMNPKQILEVARVASCLTMVSPRKQTIAASDALASAESSYRQLLAVELVDCGYVGPRDGPQMMAAALVDVESHR